ncbi:YncE family protein [Actinoplanes sp. HUAS TT8]|uniref:YncE family protein n=1 Tax=Actinoplanes sp. HUAS TT8 TaxID=3447453 RepID=UPI003F523200
MTTRRNFLTLAAAASGLALAGCRETPESTAAPDLLLAGTGRGLVRLTPQGELAYGTEAVLSSDNARIMTVREGSLTQIATGTGVATGTTRLPAGWLPRVISPDGRAGALTRTPPSVIPSGRARTELLVVIDKNPRVYDLPGAIEPDAFTLDATGLFVLDWLPAAAPDHYRVRRLDLADGTLQPLFTRDKSPVPNGAEEEMRGEGRQAVPSADGRLLLTLYTHQPGHQHTRDLLSGRPGNAHAFVHVLNLAEGWAYCVDLPHPFGEGPPEGHAIAADSWGAAVVDSASGRMAYANLESLAVDRVVAAPIPAGASSALVMGPDRRIYAGAGDRITVLNRDTDVVEASRPVPGVVRGLGLSRDGARLYAGTPGAVHWFSAADGRALGSRAVPDLTGLRSVG